MTWQEISGSVLCGVVSGSNRLYISYISTDFIQYLWLCVKGMATVHSEWLVQCHSTVVTPTSRVALVAQLLEYICLESRVSWVQIPPTAALLSLKNILGFPCPFLVVFSRERFHLQQTGDRVQTGPWSWVWPVSSSNLLLWSQCLHMWLTPVRHHGWRCTGPGKKNNIKCGHLAFQSVVFAYSQLKIFGGHNCNNLPQKVCTNTHLESV